MYHHHTKIYYKLFIERESLIDLSKELNHFPSTRCEHYTTIIK